MNERIKELAEQAKKYALDAMIKITDKEQALKVYSETYDTKFAKLIIEECAGFLRDTLDDHFAAEQLVEHFGVEPESEPVANTLTFMTRAIFNVVAKHQEINGGYFIADGDVDDFVGRLAKVINVTFDPLKSKNTT